MTKNVLGNLSKGILFVVSAPAGTGKTTLVRMLCDEFPKVLESVSCTTRPMRDGEIEGRDYHYLTKEAFDEKRVNGDFLEDAIVFGYQYGTSKQYVEKELEKGFHVVLIVDTQGAATIRKMMGGVFIFIKPPSMAILRDRLFNRKTESSKHIEERLAWATHELTQEKHYDYQITNDNLHTAYDALRSIFIAEEHRVHRT